MGLFDQDLTLPGVVTEIISDYSSGYDTSLFGTTDSVAIVGTSFNGPVGKPIAIYSPEHARYVFGPVYDSKTRREATLVADIQDAWDRGCRTIYAVRISGKPIHKDFQLALDTNLKLRVSGIFPSNANKEISMLFDNDDYDMNIKIFKPADRATIQEKKQGFVDKKESVLVNSIDLYNSGLSKTDDLTELVKRVNEYPYNNVIRLAIVDEKGNDVTLSSTDAKGLKIADMFPGLYLIGRDKNGIGVIADTQVKLKLNKDYNGENSLGLYKELTINTNVINDLPIFANEGKETLAANLGVNMIEEFDFLVVPGKIDSIFIKDSIDYEEVDLNDFEIYKRLGSGFATTSHVVIDSTGLKAKVKETTDALNKKAEIKDGIYSMLENLNAKYRVLTGVNADVSIKGRLPKAEEFRISVPKTVKLFNDTVNLTTVIGEKDFTIPKNYELSFAELTDVEETAVKAIAAEALINKTVREATVITKANLQLNNVKYKEGSLFLCLDDTVSEDLTDVVAKLYMYSKGVFNCLHSINPGASLDSVAGTYIVADGKLYICDKKTTIPSTTVIVSTFQLAVLSVAENILVALDNGTFQVAQASIDSSVALYGTAEQVFSESEDKVLTAYTSNYGVNKVVVKSNQFDFTTVDELVEYLNGNKDFSQLFNLTVTDITGAQEYVKDILDMASTPKSYSFTEKTLGYDTNLFVPFRTDDSFARHLAQHCMYTSLKTAPTHGVIGCKSLLDINLDSVAKRTKELVDLRLDSLLVAKKSNGTNMLDANNMPYPIGRKVSVVVGQYLVRTEDNYTYVSNMASGYAGMISALPLDQSSTCQPIAIPEPMYELTNYQLGLLTAAGFVTTKKSYSKGWVVTDGITMAPGESPYKRLSASRIADGIEDVIRKVCEAYIGKQNNLTNQNSLRSAIKSELDKLKDKLIEAYDFKLILDKASTKLGIINIDYSIVPIYEIKEIINRITIKE